MSWARTLYLVAILCALILAGNTWAGVIYVDDDAPAGGDGASWATAYHCLQDALAVADLAEKPVEIHVASGLYKPDEFEWAPDGTGQQDVYFELRDGVSLIGGYGGLADSDPDIWDPDVYETTLSGDLGGNDAEVTDPTLLREDPTRYENTDSAVVEIANGQTVLSGCTITGGTGAGVFLNQYPWSATNDVTITDCRFYGNRGNEYSPLRAGALSSWLSPTESQIVVRRCSFVGNAGWSGGAVGISGVLEHCQFIRNHAWGIGNGGAASLSGNSTVTHCVFIENSTNRSGGALSIGSSLSASNVVRCIFRNNLAGERGGGIACNGNIDMDECVFVGNKAGTSGGAGYDYAYSNIRLTNCLMIGNWGEEQGGGWFSHQGDSFEMANCVSWGNRAVRGTFLAIDRKTDAIAESTVVANSLLSNGDDEIWSDGSPVSVAYTCFAQGLGTLSNADDWLTMGAGIIEIDPCLVDPGYWDDNGTVDDPSDDFFVEGDYHLRSQAGRWDPASESWVQDEVTSPCIDAGDPNSPIMYEPFPSGGIINMGAYGGTAEASKSYFGDAVCETILAGDINGDCKVDMLDLVLLLDHWTDE